MNPFENNTPTPPKTPTAPETPTITPPTPTAPNPNPDFTPNDPTIPTTPPSPTLPPSPTNQKNNKLLTIAIAVISVIVLLAIAIILVLVLSKPKTPEKPTTPPETSVDTPTDDTPKGIRTIQCIKTIDSTTTVGDIPLIEIVHPGAIKSEAIITFNFNTELMPEIEYNIQDVLADTTSSYTIFYPNEDGTIREETNSEEEATTKTTAQEIIDLSSTFTISTIENTAFAASNKPPYLCKEF